ncbi:hypothetical protein X802_05605 [Thermococcus guaymasensis DSM 11113]|uniref:Uncharacterized protein n=1 Tax=Thermococcus guaymasensis DSM 11113 TaxID=1432656 RepID=A0A0X1KN66_9EURY|nr:hypothetical protein [Thermococcus guaymasensis]AJC72724.1 hypothetical protein X802_05605 [Thermococcus guaymasensis DSM 11113]
MRWLGKRLTSDPGTILLVVLSPALAYYGMWRKASSYWPAGLNSHEKLVPCGNTTLPRDVLSHANEFFSKLSSLQGAAFSETLHWGLFAVFFLSGAFVAYSFGRALSTGDVINVIPLLGSKGRTFIEYFKVSLLYALFLSGTLAFSSGLIFETYSFSVEPKLVISVFLAFFGSALWGISLALLTLSLLREHASALLSLIGVVLLASSGGNTGAVLMPYDQVFLWVFSGFRTSPSKYAVLGVVLSVLSLVAAYLIFERRDIG